MEEPPTEGAQSSNPENDPSTEETGIPTPPDVRRLASLIFEDDNPDGPRPVDLPVPALAGGSMGNVIPPNLSTAPDLHGAIATLQQRLQTQTVENVSSLDAF